MVINIFLILLCLGAATIWYQGIRFQKFIVSAIILLLSIILFYFNQGLQSGVFSQYSYGWLTSKYYPVSLDFFTTKESYHLIIPLLFAVILCNFFSISNQIERQKVSVSALSVFSVAALIMLICGQNTIQLLVSVCFIDVLGFCVINNINARRQYIFYNLLADLALFMAFAILWGNCRINSLVNLTECHHSYNNVAEWLIVLSAWIKSGLFPFQGYFVRTAILNDSRQNILSFLSTPLAGFLLMYKVKSLIPDDFIGIEILKYAAQASLVWGIIGGIFINRLADRKIYMNMTFYGLIYSVLFYFQTLPREMVALFLIHIILSNLIRATRRYATGIFIVTFLVVGAIVNTALLLNNPIVPLYLVAVMVTLSGCLFVLYSSDQEENHWINLFLAMGISLMFLYGIKTVPTSFYLWMGGYVLLNLLQPYKLLTKIYANQNIQQADGFSKIFYILFVSPVEFLGRILWLTIDFLIIERTLLSWLAKITGILSQLFGYLHKPTYKNALIFTLIGIGIILYSSWQGK